MATRDALLVHEECEHTVVNMTDNTTTVFTGPCVLLGIHVNITLSANACEIENVAGTSVFTLAASTAAGTNIHCHGMRFDDALIVNPADAATLSIADGETVKVISRRGKVVAKAKVTDVSPPGVVTMDIHFGESGANVLTNPALDPVSKIPELKTCAVRVEKTRERVNIYLVKTRERGNSYIFTLVSFGHVYSPPCESSVYSRIG